MQGGKWDKHKSEWMINMKKTNKANRMSVAECATLMGIAQQTLRVGIQRGRFPFAFAVKRKSKWCYFISPVKFTEATGIRVE